MHPRIISLYQSRRYGHYDFRYRMTDKKQHHICETIVDWVEKTKAISSNDIKTDQYVREEAHELVCQLLDIMKIEMYYKGDRIA